MDEKAIELIGCFFFYSDNKKSQPYKEGPAHRLNRIILDLRYDTLAARLLNLLKHRLISQTEPVILQ